MERRLAVRLGGGQSGNPLVDQRRELGHALEVGIGPSRLQLGATRCSPQRGGRFDPSGVSCEHIENGVADKERVFGEAIEAVECYPYGLGVGLVSGAAVAADDGVHVTSEPDVSQAAQRERLGLAGDDPEIVAAVAQHFHRVDDVVVAAGEAIVVRHLVLAIGGEEGEAVSFVAGVAAEHGHERDADAGEPFLVARSDTVELFEGEPGRLENQLDRVEESAVEIEEDRRTNAGGAGIGGHGDDRR